ncbi:adenylate/guanylate cyclase domain-containing protein [Plebeiibacterium sediminum]|uniref:HD domain-containing protein n=1 Tax=Plebeiibacterium sediminum TaxID=2992112 RepID=A0AAE3SDF0_9BACT|nr:adenylate/guanylate cyclase domain-containing protein [Plebeiobacterium sediminum]MCW3785115.1 HD domain-containing protein [Plebeiobacterium sediminum]
MIGYVRDVYRYKFGLFIFLYQIVILSHSVYASANLNISEKLIQNIIVSGDTINTDQINDDFLLEISTDDFIEFDFFNLSSVKEKYKFYLKDFETQPQNWTYKNSCSYYNLDSGNYIFIVQTEKASQSIHIQVKSGVSRYLVSSIILVVFVFVFFVIIKIGVVDLLNKKVNDWHQDSIAPLFSKYLKPKVDTNEEENRKLTHKATVKYEKATVLFADIQGFTKIVEHLNPETLIDELDRFFVYFDEVAEKHQIEKIKTIGDAYMCAGGLPEKNSTNPVEVVLAALEMQRYMQKSKHSSNVHSDEFWQLRIGIHTGPVISGVIGRKKLSFDIWGDTVNIASRMESSGVAGKINVSGITYQLIKDFFTCEYRGKMPIKYKGETDMYFVTGIVPHLSVDEEGLIPNDAFKTKLQWIRYNDLEELVLTQLRQELPSSLKYHNVKHTIDVCTQVEVIGRAEGLNSKELLLVKTAALFHDTGYMVNPDKHEIQSARIAREILPKFNYSGSEIEAINQLIMATEMNVEPKLLMEKIIKDADLDYLGRADFIPLSEKLWEEVCYFNGKMTQREWNKKQYDFISKHVYYTNTAKNLRQVNKEIQLKKIKEFLV